MKTEPTCIFSRDGRFRYTLNRTWGPGSRVAFIGLNPSTADELEDDPTIRRCIGFAKSWGYGSLLMLNLFGLRSTDPKKLYTVNNPVGGANDFQIHRGFIRAQRIVAAWGVHGEYLGRGEEIRRQYHDRLWHLGLTKGGYPKHPLYLRADTKPMMWA